MARDASTDIAATAAVRNGQYGGSSFFGRPIGVEAANPMKLPATFPNGARAAVLLTFDVEGFYGNGSGDEALEVRNYSRMAERMAALGLKGTFNVVGRMAQERGPDFVRLLHQAGMELATHGYEHEMTGAGEGLTYHGHYGLKENLEDLGRGVEAIQDITGVPVRGARVPYGHFNEHSYRAMERLGLAWASNMEIDNFLRPEDAFGPAPFRPAIGGKVCDIVEIPLDSQTYDWAMWIADENNPSFVARVNAFMQSRGLHAARTPAGAATVWEERIRSAIESESVFTLLCHPINLTVRSERWSGDPLEDFLFKVFDRLAELQKGQKVWVPTCAELADFYRAQEGRKPQA